MALLPQPPPPPDETPLFFLVDGAGTIVQACQLEDDARRALKLRKERFGQELTLRPGTADELPTREKNAARRALRGLGKAEPRQP